MLMVVRLEFTSSPDMLDCVQAIADRLTRQLGMDDETGQYVSVAIRESVINAIRHGNRDDPARHVFVEFSTTSLGDEIQLMIRVRDQGAGFDPGEIRDPLAPENVTRSSGRGIFLIRSFMDDVQVATAPEGGTEVRMTKRIGVRRTADADGPAEGGPHARGTPGSNSGTRSSISPDGH
jgi:serine/threonine-protein kinase RsbW